MNNIRGIECSLYNGQIEEVLLFLSTKPVCFYVSQCTKITGNQMILPQLSGDYPISSQELKELAKESIWELVMHIYPVGINKAQIKTYDDFLRSPCLCCLIFYDCGLLDIYIKDAKLREQLWDLLTSLAARNMELITDGSDRRTILHA